MPWERIRRFNTLITLVRHGIAGWAVLSSAAVTTVGAAYLATMTSWWHDLGVVVQTASFLTTVMLLQFALVRGYGAFQHSRPALSRRQYSNRVRALRKAIVDAFRVSEDAVLKKRPPTAAQAAIGDLRKLFDTLAPSIGDSATHEINALIWTLDDVVVPGAGDVHRGIGQARKYRDAALLHLDNLLSTMA